MLGVLGLDPADPHWADRRRVRATCTAVVDALVKGLLEQRAEARASQGLRRRRRDPRPDQGRRHRDRGHPRRPALERAGCQVTRSARARSRRPARATRRPVPAAGCAAASRARGRRPRPRTGRTTRPTRRSPKTRRSTGSRPRRPMGKGGGDHEWIAGRNSVVEALRAGLPDHLGVRRRGCRARRPAARGLRDRGRQGHLAARGASGRARPDDRRGGAPGTGRARAGLRVRRPDGLPRRRRRQRREAADRGARLGDRPAQPRRRRTLRRRASARTAW